jgi:threonine/homoserine/homoserine lactone efflux protein
MTIPPENYLLVPLSIGFAGSLSFSPINLCVVDTTVRHNLRAGLWFSAAATLIEGLHAYIAIYFGEMYPEFLRQYPWIHLVILVFFVVLGISFLLRNPAPPEASSGKGQGKHFLQGFFIALMNPQGIPYWILVLAYLQSAQWFEIDSNVQQSGLMLFLTGVMLGKFGALALFGMLSNVINSRTALLQQWTDKITGGILIALGVLQAFQYFLF